MTAAGTKSGNPAGNPAGTSTARVIRGGSRPLLWSLTAQQQDAIGALVERQTGFCTGFCTGTLIASNVVLTAAHCMEGIEPDSFEFVLGSTTEFPTKVCRVAEVRVHPLWTGTAAHDIALIILREPVPASIATPFAINREPLPNLSGKNVQNVGYGVTNPGMTRNVNPLRLWTVEPVVAVRGGDFAVSGGQISSVCGGDSGSPSLYQFPDGRIRVIGTLHGGDSSCIGTDNYARTDADAAWILSGGLSGGTQRRIAGKSVMPGTPPSYVWIGAASLLGLLGLTATVVALRRRGR